MKPDNNEIQLLIEESVKKQTEQLQINELNLKK